MNKKRALAYWMLKTDTFKTHDVLQWGLDNFYNGADRIKRNLKEKGLIRQLMDHETNSKEAVYQVNIEEMEEYLKR